MKKLRLLLIAAGSLVLPLGASSMAIAADVNTGGKYRVFEFRGVGPTRGGRVTAVTGTVAAPSIFYLGASGGGVWKTEDYGASWRNVSDGFFATPSIGDIAIAQNDANIVYVGTGSDGLRSNVIEGKGVYKSIDGGESWRHVGLGQVGQIGAVEIDPTNHNIVYVAAIGRAFRANAERGLYKSADGGRSWKKILFISNKVGITDVELHPTNPNILFASAWKTERKPWTIISGGEITEDEAGIYRSVDGGDSWEKIITGLPIGLVGKIDLATTPADSRVLAALVEAPGKEGGLYWSVDQGQSFEHVSNDKGIQNRPFYYTNIDIDPQNAEVIYSNANPLSKSVDGGKTWSTISVPHGDNHDMWINPDNPDLFIQSNDGGANVTHNGGKTWSSQFNQPTAELYSVEVDDQHPYWLYAGQQDNSSTIAVPSMPPFGAQHTNSFIINTGGCETGPAAPKPGNHNIVYANCKGRFGVYDKRTGTERSYYVGATNIYGHNPANLKNRFQRVAPVHVSPHDPDTVYHGSQYLHRTRDGGVTWEIISPDLTANEPDKQVISGAPITRDITGEEYYSAIYSVQESTVRKGVIWTGANDGPVYVTRDDGQTWQNVTPRMPKGGRVDSVTPSPHDPAKAYISVLRYQLGDPKPYIYRTDNYGKSWSLLSNGKNGIPADYPVRVVRESPEYEGLLFAGTEFGLFMSNDDGKNWTAFQQNLPITPVTDLKFVRGDLVLSTMGRGFWVLDNVTSLGQSAMHSLGGEMVVFMPKDTYRYRHPRVMPRAGVSAGVPDLPEPTVSIDYYVPAGDHKDIRIDILDSAGELVNSFYNDGAASEDESEDDRGKDTKSENAISEDALPYIHDKTLEMEVGLNRFYWDMTYLGPWHKDKEEQFRADILVPPGAYQLRVTLDGRAAPAQSFALMIDPRLVDQGVVTADIEEQITLARRVAELLSKARKLEAKVIADHEALEDEYADLPREQRGPETNAAFDRATAALEALQTPPDVIYPRARLVGQIDYLYNMLNKADQKPGRDAIERFAELSQDYQAVDDAYNR